MENVNFNPVVDTDIKRSIEDLIDESFKLKTELFKTVVMGKSFDRKSLKQFQIYVNEFLRFWSNHADSVKTAMKDVRVDDCDEELDVIEYSYIKNFIYGNFDYASILHFVDGALKGVNNKSMKNPSDIDNFRSHTIDMAFNHQDPSVAGLLDSVLSEELQSVTKKAEVLDLKMFDTVRTYNDLFSYRDRPELYRAIVKILEYIVTQKIAPKGYDHGNVRLFIGLVNNIVEYITYSLTSYAVRTFVISQYATPFIMLTHPAQDDSVLESVMPVAGISEDPNGSISSVFHDTDEMIIKDPKRSHKLIERYVEFLKLIGAAPLSTDPDPDHHDSYLDKKTKTSNKLYNELKDNPLYDFFTNGVHFHSNHDKDLNAIEMNQKLKSIMYSKFQGLQGHVTPKNDFIRTVQTVYYGDTVKECKELARDIAMIAIELGKKIAHMLSDTSWQMEDEIAGNNLKLGARKSVAENIRFLLDIYEETSFVFAQKAGYLERKINELRASDIKKVISITSLNIPGMKSDLTMADSMMLSAPDTGKVLQEHVDLYSRPIFEAYEMYDDYLRTLPEFANDWYLKEITDAESTTGTDVKDKIVDTVGSTVSSIINKLKAIIQALWQRIQYFWNSQSFVLAKKWVLDNEEMLKGLQFPADAKLEVLPYKDEIALPQGFSNLQKNLMAFDEKVVASSDTIQKYLRSLYPSDQIAQWFADDTTGTVAAQKYMNLILFDEGSEQPKAPIVIAGPDLSKKMAVWINTMKETDATKDGFKKINDDINNAIGSINTKIVSVNNQNKAAVAQQAPDTGSTNASQAAPLPDPNAPQPNQNNAQPAAPDQSNTSMISDVSTKISVTITRLWSPLAPMIIRAMMNQYGYIKAAYALGQVAPQSHTPEGGAQPQKGQL